MRKIIFVAFVLFLPAAVSAQDLHEACEKFNDLNNQILKGTVKKEDFIKAFSKLREEIGQASFRESKAYLVGSPWIFPLRGYSYTAIGGTNGNGYSDKGYHYLDGNKHLAHPAHDIFIRDKNQDCIDDKTHQPVNVLAIDDGIVIACTNEWATDSDLRGGRFIWIYHPQWSLITYYAHNREIFVKPGDHVKQGQKLAEVGRTGLNAYPKRSPTHLHFSAFHIINGLPVPFNPYTELKKATKQ